MRVQSLGRSVDARRQEMKNNGVFVCMFVHVGLCLSRWVSRKEVRTFNNV